MKEQVTEKKCYNSWSCILSVAIILFVLGSVIYDMTISKPEMRKNINEIKVEVQEINEKINAQSAVYFMDADANAEIANNEDK